VAKIDILRQTPERTVADIRDEEYEIVEKDYHGRLWLESRV